METYTAKEIITNNIVRAVNNMGDNVILIGKGIGFKKHENDVISPSGVNNIYTIKDKQETSLYNQLLKTTSPKLVDITNDCIDYIQNHVNQSLNEHIHVALTDHIAFMVRRCKMNLPILNPFEVEINGIYPNEYKIAQNVVNYLSEELSLFIPKSEISFITLHIVSSLNNDSLVNTNKHTALIMKILNLIEQDFSIKLQHSDLNFIRLITHIRFSIERIERNEKLEVPKEMEELIKDKYKELYTLAYKIVKIMQNELNKSIDQAEVIYFTMHLYRFDEKNKNTIIGQ